MELKTAFFLLMIFFSASGWAVSSNDVSVLLPLPKPDEMAFLLGPEDQGLQGPLLSLAAYKKMNPLVPEHSNAMVWRDQLKVIALRIDPCFVEGEGPMPCRRQIRLVWQPIVFAKGQAVARDAAIHSFYEFDAETFEKIKKSWFQVSRSEAGESLQVQPQILAEGWRGLYWQNLRQLVLQNCGENSLVRMTTMNVLAGEQLWIFAGFDIRDQQVLPIEIPRLDKTSQGVISGSSSFQSFTGGLMPGPAEDADVVEFLEDSSTFKKTYSEEQVRTVIGKIQDYENPRKHNPGTLDCASCHMADSIHRWGRLNYPQWNWSENSPEPTPLRTNQLRVFGYFMAWPVTSQRVINETAEVLHSLGQ